MALLRLLAAAKSTSVAAAAASKAAAAHSTWPALALAPGQANAKEVLFTLAQATAANEAYSKWRARPSGG